jgi:hypothetical protein
MTSEVFQALMRHALGALATYLVTSGVIAQSDAEPLIGALLALATVAWSIWNKHQHAQQLSGISGIPSAGPLTGLPKSLIMVVALSGLLALSGCAQYRQGIEAGANVALQDVKAADDDVARAVAIAPQAITLGAFSRFPDGAQKCALATLAGVNVNGCALTPDVIKQIVADQMTQHFGATSKPLD